MIVFNLQVLALLAGAFLIGLLLGLLLRLKLRHRAADIARSAQDRAAGL